MQKPFPPSSTKFLLNLCLKCRNLLLNYSQLQEFFRVALKRPVFFCKYRSSKLFFYWLILRSVLISTEQPLFVKRLSPNVTILNKIGYWENKLQRYFITCAQYAFPPNEISNVLTKLPRGCRLSCRQSRKQPARYVPSYSVIPSPIETLPVFCWKP